MKNSVNVVDSGYQFLTRLKTVYLVVLTVVALVAISIQYPVRNCLSEIDVKAEIINVAGQQRMLSQRISKTAYAIAEARRNDQHIRQMGLANRIQADLEQLLKSHEALKHRNAETGFPGRNSDETKQQFANLQRFVNVFRNTVLKLICETMANPGVMEFEELADRIDKASIEFLPVMDEIVENYEHESHVALSGLIRLAAIFSISTILLLAITVIFVFEPTAKMLRSTLQRLFAHIAAVDNAWDRLEISPDGTIVDANESFCQTMSFAPNQIIGQSYQRLIRPGDFEHENFQEFWQQVLTGELQNSNVKRLAGDGSMRYLQTTFQPIYQQDGKGIAKIVNFSFDMTEQHQLREQLDSVRKDVDQAIEGARVGLWRWEPKKNRLWYSVQFQRLLGYVDEDLGTLCPTMDSLMSMVHNEDRSTVLDGISRHLSMGSLYDIEYRLQTKSGDYRWFRSAGKANRDENGAAIAMAGSIVDISSQKNAEQELLTTMQELEEATAIANSMTAIAEAANLSKSEFLANMSHEIRTPMTAILGFTNVLLNEPGLDQAPKQRREALETIDRNGNHLLAVINDILDMSKIEAGKMSVESVQTDLAPLINDTLALVQAKADEKSLQLKLELESPIPSSLKTDPTRFRQILFNLLSNAIKFTSSGSVTMKLNWNQNNEFLRVCVVDTGIGMDHQQLEKIRKFSAFSQADSNTTRRYGGTGLGLTISSSLCKLLGGELTVDSEKGRGSTFTAAIPTGQINGGRVIEKTTSENRLPNDIAAKKPVAIECPLKGLRVLVAEDGVDNQRLVKFLLNKAGAEVVIAENGRIAVDTYSSTPDGFDIILMDMQMPELDGYGATDLLKSQGCPIPIVALTANAMSSDRDKCIAAGCDGFVCKPFVKERLFQTIVEMTDIYNKDKAAFLKSSISSRG